MLCMYVRIIFACTYMQRERERLKDIRGGRDIPMSDSYVNAPTLYPMCVTARQRREVLLIPNSPK